MGTWESEYAPWQRSEKSLSVLHQGEVDVCPLDCHQPGESGQAC